MFDLEIYVMLVGNKLSDNKTKLIHQGLSMTKSDESFHDYSTYGHVHNSSFYLHLRDSTGNENFESLRKISYTEDRNFVMLVYDPSDKKSFDDIKNLWAKELKDKATTLAFYKTPEAAEKAYKDSLAPMREAMEMGKGKGKGKK